MPRKRDLREEIDELFADLWQVSRLGGLRRGFRPQLDCFRTEDPETYTVVVDISGIDPEAVHVTMSEHALVISGERHRDESGGRTYQQMEIEYGLFQRVIQLPEDADLSAAEASYDQGLLRIVIPIAKPAPRVRPVPIQVRRDA